ncbi:MAG: bifunctional metallophosphatase/5'-nucleotidase [Elusimicrobia bacterium]|nr:bifunctional metallophosphatase/5'-nucleotidase [Elusimicrobiota bacterium]
MKKNLIIALTITLFSSIALSAEIISVYNTADVHGWYFPRAAHWNKENPKREIGGFSAFSSLLKKEKNPYILLDSGDMFQGTPEGNLTKGKASIALMNYLEYSAVAIGNHEYDYSENNVKKLVKKAKFPFLGANVYYKENGRSAEYLKPYTIVTKADKKIAILGLAGEHTSKSTLPTYVEHLDFKNEAKEAAKWVKEIKKHNPDVIIALVHFGMAGLTRERIDVSTWTFPSQSYAYGTLALTRTAPAIDVIFGGHNHNVLPKGYYDEASSTLICESYWGLTDVTKVDLEFDDETGKFIKARASLITLWTNETGKDEKVAKILEKFTEKVDKEMSQIIGESNVPLGTSEEGLDSPIGNWMTDVMKKYAKTDLAFQNTTGIRSVMNKGIITMRDIYQIMPFDNTLVTLKITGKLLEKLMRDNLRNSYSKMQISGMKVKFKTNKKNNPSDIEMYINSKLIKPEDEFTVITNNYLTSGGSGGMAFTLSKDLHDTMAPIRDILIQSVKTSSPIEEPEGSRIIKID